MEWERSLIRWMRTAGVREQAAADEARVRAPRGAVRVPGVQQAPQVAGDARGPHAAPHRREALRLPLLPLRLPGKAPVRFHPVPEKVNVSIS